MNATSIAKPFLAAVSQDADGIAVKLNRKPKLLGLLANADEPSRLYAKSTAKACEDVGLEFQLLTVGSKEDPSQPFDVEQAIIEANLNDQIDGILVYFPIFGLSEDQYLQQVVSPAKDVEGLHFLFRFNLYHNIRWLEPSVLATGKPPPLSAAEDRAGVEPPRPGLVKAILPCTSLAIVKVLEAIGVYNQVLAYGKRAFGKTITVINRSEVVGRPLAALLANDGARVFSVDINNIVEYTRRKPAAAGSELPAWHPQHITSACDLTLQQCLEISDVVVSGVPSASYKVPTSQLKDGVVAVNFASAKNFQEDIKERASIYIPNIGKVTIAMLMRNLLRLVTYRKLQAEQTPAP